MPQQAKSERPIRSLPLAALINRSMTVAALMNRSMTVAALVNRSMTVAVLINRSMTVAVLIAFCAVSAFAQSGGGYNIKKSTIDSGGHSNLTDLDGTYKLGGTIGQHDAVVLTDINSIYKLTGGFWSPAATGTPPNDILWDPATNPGPWPNANPLATTRSLRFTVDGPAGPSTLEAIKVTMIDLQHPRPANLAAQAPPNFTPYDTRLNGVCNGGTLVGHHCDADADCPPGVVVGRCSSLVACTAVGEANSCARWVGKPGTFLESQDGGPLFGTYRAARLQCTPFYFDWITETASAPITVVGAEIVPSSEYSGQVYGASCMGAEAGCTSVSTSVTMYTRRSGDAAPNFNPPATSTQPDALDVAAVVNKLKNLPGALVKAITQLQPNLPELNADVNALDIVAVVDGVKGVKYGFSGPCACPSAVTCGSTACSTDTPCTTAYGAGAKCVKTCVGGVNMGDPCINNTHCLGGNCGTGFCRDRCGRCTP